MQNKLKDDKQKVTLYLPQDLHRQLKIKAAVDSETMTDIAQRAIVFFLSNPEVVEQFESGYGNTHRVYSCPECSSQVVIREGQIVSLQHQSNVLIEEAISVEKAGIASSHSQDEGELVPC